MARRRAVAKELNGFDDWNSIRLDQIGAGRNLLRLSNGDNDVGDNDVGDNDVGDNDVGDNDVGDNDVGDNDVGDNDVGDNDVGAAEQDFESTKAQGRTPPYALETCILGGILGAGGCTGPQPQPFDPLYHKILARMQPTTFGHVVEYEWEFKRVPANLFPVDVRWSNDFDDVYPWPAAERRPVHDSRQGGVRRPRRVQRIHADYSARHDGNRRQRCARREPQHVHSFAELDHKCSGRSRGAGERYRRRYAELLAGRGPVRHVFERHVDAQRQRFLHVPHQRLPRNRHLYV